MTVLFTNGTDDGNSPKTHESIGSIHTVQVSGVFDGASVDIQSQSNNDPGFPNGRWISHKIYTIDAADPMAWLPLGFIVRAVITEAGDDTDIFAEVRV